MKSRYKYINQIKFHDCNLKKSVQYKFGEIYVDNFYDFFFGFFCLINPANCVNCCIEMLMIFVTI
jgi:hypothetical protein